MAASRGVSEWPGPLLCFGASLQVTGGRRGGSDGGTGNARAHGTPCRHPSSLGPFSPQADALPTEPNQLGLSSLFKKCCGSIRWLFIVKILELICVSND